MYNMQWRAVTEDNLKKIATELLQNIKYPIILFKGGLGAGKTTFIKSIVESIGTQDHVSSPTFSLVNEYETSKGKIYHFDFYRIEDEEEAYDMGAEEYFYSDNYCFIEWPERVENIIPEEYHTVTINVEDGERIIKLDNE